MTSVLRLGVYRERIEKYGAGGGGCRRQVSQPQQDVPGSQYTDVARTTFPVSKTNNISDTQDKELPPYSSNSPDNRICHRAQPAVVEENGKIGKGNVKIFRIQLLEIFFLTKRKYINRVYLYKIYFTFSSTN